MCIAVLLDTYNTEFCVCLVNNAATRQNSFFIRQIKQAEGMYKPYFLIDL